MNAAITSKENNVVKFTFEVGADKLEEGMKYAYNKNKGKFAIPGFRKGKAPRKIIEAQYGTGVFLDDAVNFVLNEEYEGAVKELGLDVVSRPTVDIESLDKETGVKFTIDVTVKPEVTLGTYKGLEYEKTSVEVKDDEIEAELKKVQEQNARMSSVSDRAAQMGDIVNISYSGAVDGVPFEGGAAGSYDLTLGSHSFIDTFEDQIVGHAIGDKFDVTVTFPEEYHAKELCGKEAVFAVELKDISVKELPELNDEFAQDVSEFETLEEYKASIVDKMKADKEEKAKGNMNDALIRQAVENATMDVPEIMIENRIDQLVQNFENNITRQGISLDVYCQYMGTTKEELRKTFRDPAEATVKSRLVLEQIARDENLTASREEIDEEIAKLGTAYGIEKEKMLEYIKEDERSNFEKDILADKALQVIVDNAVETEPKAVEAENEAK